MTHEELQDLLAPYALGCLSGEDRTALEAHLASGCGSCRKTLADFTAAGLALSVSAPPLAPPARVKRELLRRIRPQVQTRWAWQFAMAAGVLVVAGVFLRNSRAVTIGVAGVTGTLRAEGALLRAGGAVRAGQRLATGENSAADLRVAQRAVFHLGPASEAVVEEIDDGLLVSLHRGTILSVVKHGTAYAVHTPEATASALGTVFYVEALTPGKTYVCLCSGRLRVSAPGRSQLLATDHHQAVDVTAVAGGAAITPAGMFNHTDADIDALKTLLK